MALVKPRPGASAPRRSFFSSIHSCMKHHVKKVARLTGILQAEKRPDHFGGVFTVHDDPSKKPDKEEERKVKGILERLRHYGIDTMVESNVQYALRASSSNGDSEAAFRLLMLLQDTFEGIVKPYTPETRLVGAVNRENVTCYLDALLFAMFARLDSFEAMLYDNFNDLPRKKLAGLLRLWVNMLRTGLLITTDITAHLQSALSECGWADATRLKQQDPSEAFTFITGQLELPLLTLKMDLYHTGKEDPQDDHKFVNERLLEVAILDEPPEGSSVLTLEDCLEHYFNNRIEVKRHMEERRRNTLKSANSGQPDSSIKKADTEPGLHVEVVDITDRSDTPLVQSPAVETPVEPSPSQSKDPLERLRPTSGRKRADSIFSQRKIELKELEHGQVTETDGAPDTRPGRKMSTRTEVLMPAWQFFKLLPWYTDHQPTSDAQVAAHFAKKRPVLGICLKRYAYTMEGQATRRNDYIDIPLEIGVPNFVSDEHMQQDGPLVGNFRLLLQSVVCHRGVSVHSGHYVTLCRGRATNAQRQQAQDSEYGSPDSEEVEDPWMLFDDIARERVRYVDIHQALKDETPYLLFYQVQPIGDDGHSIHDLPTYAEATSRSHSETMATLEKPYLHEPPGSDNALANSTLNLHHIESHSSQPRSEVTDFANGSTRTSLDVNNTGMDLPRGRSSGSFAVYPPAAGAADGQRRRSIAFDARSFVGSNAGGSDPASSSVPATPSEEKSTGGFLGLRSKIGTRRGSRGTKSAAASRSRPTSVVDENRNGSRFSLNMSKLTQRMSRGNGGEAASQQQQEQVSAPSVPAGIVILEPPQLPADGPAKAATPGDQEKPIDPAAADSSAHSHPLGTLHVDSPAKPSKPDPGTSTTSLPSHSEEGPMATATVTSIPDDKAASKESLKPKPNHTGTLSKRKEEKAAKRRSKGLAKEERECVVM
jgi:hypothetical protein